ncbi:MAG: hypothetical protein WCR52_05790 [Bacteroidota bacterium]
MSFQIAENTLRKSIVGIMALVFLGSFWAFDRWPEELDGGDSLGYYIHLPSYLIYHDVGDYEKTLTGSAKYYTRVIVEGERHFTPEPAPNGKRSIRWPVGVAIMTLPFFIVAHLFCFITGMYPADGFSTPYMLFAGLAPIFYVLLGLWFLFGVLRRYFSRKTSIVTLLTIGLATNLFYFTGYHNYMSHGFLFALVAILMHRTVLFWEQSNAKNAAWVGAIVGLIALTRLHDIMVVFIPLFWGVVSWRTLIDRILFFVKKWYLFAIAAFTGALMLVPQSLYYKAISGKWWWYAYGSEKLDFAHPHILGGLFDYKNGWLLYTPVMVFALIGIFRLKRHVKDALLPILIVLPLHAYIAYSWWCWFYTNGYGSRPMVDLYALLALPMAALFEPILRRNWSAILLSIVLVGFSFLNIFQVWQFEHGILWSQFEKKAHFWSVFGQTKHSMKALIAMESDEMQPNSPESLVLVKRQFENGMEDSTGTMFTSAIKHGGKFGLQMNDQEFGATMANEAGTLPEIKSGDWIRASVWGYTKDSEKLRDILEEASLVLVLQDNQGKVYKYSQIHIANKINNPDGSIWNSGDTNRWGEAVFYVKVPRGFPSNGVIKTYVWNPNREHIWIDDLSVELLRKP